MTQIYWLSLYTKRLTQFLGHNLDFGVVLIKAVGEEPTFLLFVYVVSFCHQGNKEDQ